MYQSIEEAPTEGDFSIKNSGRGKALAHSASEFKRHYLIRALLVSLMCGVVLLGLDGHGSPQLTDAVGRNSRGVSTFLSENNVKPCEEYSLQCCSDPSAPVLGGVDVVAYFQIVPGSYAVMGSPEFFSTLRTSDAEYTFFFSSLENKEYFDDDPWQYIPECGGFDARRSPPLVKVRRWGGARRPWWGRTRTSGRCCGGGCTCSGTTRRNRSSEDTPRNGWRRATAPGGSCTTAGGWPPPGATHRPAHALRGGGPAPHLRDRGPGPDGELRRRRAPPAWGPRGRR
ncbi:unnamed protein product [Heterosigma akashiwo]